VKKEITVEITSNVKRTTRMAKRRSGSRTVNASQLTKILTEEYIDRNI